MRKALQKTGNSGRRKFLALRGVRKFRLARRYALLCTDVLRLAQGRPAISTASCEKDRSPGSGTFYSCIVYFMSNRRQAARRATRAAPENWMALHGAHRTCTEERDCQPVGVPPYPHQPHACRPIARLGSLSPLRLMLYSNVLDGGRPVAQPLARAPKLL